MNMKVDLRSYNYIRAIFKLVISDVEIETELVGVKKENSWPWEFSEQESKLSSSGFPLCFGLYGKKQCK